MARIYIAASSRNHTGAAHFAGQAEAAGHTITHRWWLQVAADHAAGIQHDHELSFDARRTVAYQDALGVLAADMLVVLASPKSLGAHFECGLAWGARMPIIAVQPQNTIWEALSGWTCVTSTHEALRAIAALDTDERPDPGLWSTQPRGDEARRALAEAAANGDIGVRALTAKAFEDAQAKGWWPTEVLEKIVERHPFYWLASLALITSEVSEAMEDVRRGLWDALDRDKPVGVVSELADVILRCCNLAGAAGLDLAGAVQKKLAYNRTRPQRHGGKLA